jgi:hypothetical protein
MGYIGTVNGRGVFDAYLVRRPTERKDGLGITPTVNARSASRLQC